MASRGFPDERDSMGIHFVFCGVCLDEANRRLNVVGIGRKLELRREPVVDAEPGESRIGQRLENVGNVLLLIAGYPSTAMHQDGGREWSRTVGNVSVKGQTNSAGSGVLDIFKVSSGGECAVCQQKQHARKNVCKNFHRNVPGSLTDTAVQVAKIGLKASTSLNFNRKRARR